jgi:hypothetical protein
MNDVAKYEEAEGGVKKKKRLRCEFCFDLIEQQNIQILPKDALSMTN